MANNTLQYRENVEKLLCEREDLRKFLFVRGFLMTDKELDLSAYPFYGAWRKERVADYDFYLHPETKIYSCTGGARSCFLIGHAYDPFTMEADENRLLARVSEGSEEALLHQLNDWTGVFTFGFIEQGQLVLLSDCASMQIAYYSCIDGHLFVSTHMQMIGDLCALPVSSYVTRLTHYRFYSFYGKFLPADLSSYDGVKRIVPNTLVRFDGKNFWIERFFPKSALSMCSGEHEYEEAVERIGQIMRSTLELISQKWEHPAISMSGGMDSKGSLAAANGLYDRFQLYSYISMDGDRPDAEAAHKIAAAIGAEHRIDHIPDNDSAFEDIEAYRRLLEHNFGNIGKTNTNDVRKRVYYLSPERRGFDVETKSWVSEIARANYYKKFGLKKMPKHLSARQMTSMYKLFITDRKLVRETDRIFEEYIRDTSFDEIYNYDSSDMFLWEMRYGGWGGQVITCEHKFSYDITIPYNNRHLLTELLALPLDKRISDQSHYDLIRTLNPTIDKTGITVVNYNETKKRMIFEKLYFLINSAIPF